MKRKCMEQRPPILQMIIVRLPRSGLSARTRRHGHRSMKGTTELQETGSDLEDHQDSTTRYF